MALKRFEEQGLAKLDDHNSKEKLTKETISDDLDPCLTRGAGIRLHAMPIPRSFLVDETKKNQAPSSLFSRTGGSWFDLLDLNKGKFSSQTCFSPLGNKQVAFSLAGGHMSPLAVLMGNFSVARTRRPAGNAGNENFTTQAVNRSSAILSRRDIEKVIISAERFSIECR